MDSHLRAYNSCLVDPDFSLIHGENEHKKEHHKENHKEQKCPECPVCPVCPTCPDVAWCLLENGYPTHLLYAIVFVFLFLMITFYFFRK